MTKSELILAVSEANQIPKAMAERIVNIVLKNCKNQLIEGGRIEIRGFGSLFCKSYKGYTGRNPKSGELAHVASKRRVRFRMSETLFERLNSSLYKG